MSIPLAVLAWGPGGGAGKKAPESLQGGPGSGLWPGLSFAQEDLSPALPLTLPDRREKVAAHPDLCPYLRPHDSWS